MTDLERMKVNISEAELSLTEKPVLATTAERFLILDEIKSEYRDLPQPKQFAKSLSILLSRVSLPLEDYDLIAGRSVDRELTEAEEAVFQAFLKHPDHPKRRAFLSSGHCTYSWDMAVELGLDGLKRQAEDRLKAENDEDKRVFLESIIEIYGAISNYMLRYADEAEKKGMIAVAENLRKAAAKAPDSFYSALQLLWIIAFINCAYITQNPTLTVGRLDQILYPLYRCDLERGVLTPQLAAEYITDYYCKHNLIMGRGEHQVGDATNSTTFDRIMNFDAPQYLLLAGTDENGGSAVNELTQLFADCICPKFKNPVVVVRYFKGMDQKHPELWRTLTGKALQSASLMFYNDGNVIETYRRIGLPIEDCRKYAHFGCNWPSPGDNCAWMQGGPKATKYKTFASPEEEKRLSAPYMRMNCEHGWAEDLVIALRGLLPRENEITIEDVYTAFFDRMSEFIDRKLAHLKEELDARRRRPSSLLTFGDCFLRDSIKTAECFSAGAKYHFEFQSFYMFATTVDCFITVDKLVFIDKKTTVSELLAAADADFVGYEDILALCRSVDKYGSDTAHSNYHAKRLAETASELIIAKSRPYFEEYGLFLEPCLQSDTWHLKLGLLHGATPDGRRAHTTFSQNSRPSNGACKNGLTAMLNAMTSIPSNGFLSGALNLDVDKKQFEGENGRAVFASLLGTYFNRGGLHAQVSCTSAEDLAEAKQNPEDHRDIRVRVTGYSGIFVDMCPTLQDDIIERLK